uniref:Uncharacterized protein n=1 Tax=Timema poppense TaxID=170557 RepID=A0A7R9CNE5_TIMPO|nr:unnamed protein product [Timema poppensis]
MPGIEPGTLSSVGRHATDRAEASGAIFTEDQKDSSTELAFKYAVYRINKDKYLLPRTSLIYDIQYVPKDDSFHASKKGLCLFDEYVTPALSSRRSLFHSLSPPSHRHRQVPLSTYGRRTFGTFFRKSYPFVPIYTDPCQQVQYGVHAVFGPSDPLLGAHIHSICDALDIPHLESRLDLDAEYREFSINLFPAQRLLNVAFQDVMAFLNWTKVAIVYEEDYGLNKLRELVRSQVNQEVEVHLRQADPDTYRAVLKEIKSKEITNLVVDTRPENMHYFLKGDIETFDLEDFKYNFVNMTAFRIVDAEDVSVQEILKDMERFHPTGNLGSLTPNLDSLTSNLDSLTRNLDSLTLNLDSLTLNLDSLTGNLGSLTGNLGSLTGNLDSLTSNLDSLTRNLDSLTRNLDSLTRNLDSLTLNLDSLTLNLDSLTGNLDSLTRNLDSLTLNLDSLTLNLDSLTLNLDSLTGNLDSLTLNLDSLTGNLGSLTGWDGGRGAKFLHCSQAEPALMYDSVLVFAIGLQTLEQSHALRLSNVSCDQEMPWDGGLSLINYINSVRQASERECSDLGFGYVELKGLSGPIEFKEGRRIQFKLDLLKLKQHALVKVGEWTPSTGVNVTDRAAFFDTGTMNVTLVVITILIPYVMMHYDKNYTGNARFHGFCVDLLDRLSRDVGFDYILDLVPDKKYGAQDPETGEWNGMVLQLIKHEIPYVMHSLNPNRTGNSRYEGFCIDLLKEIANMVGFEYRIHLVPDGKYGVYDLDTGEWNGIVRQLMDKKADLAVGSMTINYARESVIDFTKPFMNLGISILFKVPTTQPTRLFSFMNPLAIEIWLYVLAAYVLVSITMFVVARFSPYEWHNPHPCDVDNDLVENQFSLANSFWFTIGTLMQQGSDLNPKATSTRIVGGIWWFFTLIIISSYTANLAAFLTVERMITPIENSDDLAGQTDISYGTLDSGSTMTFFRDSMIETYKKMWRFMENKKPSVFVPTYEEGINRVLEGNYAFLMESTMLDYIVQRDCNLTQIGGLLDTKGYGIATPMGTYF